VGFVSKLPHDLVEAFRSTLEEVALASLVLHVADASSDEVVEQIDAVRLVLAEIGAGRIPEVLALNKIDLLSEIDRERVGRRLPDAVQISALTREGLDGLLQRVAEVVPRPPVEVTVLIPYSREDLTARLYRDAEVLSSEGTEDGTLIRARVGERELAVVSDLVVRPVRTRRSVG